MDVLKRAQAILLTPRAEWPVIEREKVNANTELLLYVAVLALIPALAGFVGTSLIGVVDPDGRTARVPVDRGVLDVFMTYVLAFVAVYVVAIIVNGLAPRFGGSRNFTAALKLSVFSFTPVWLAGVFLLLPGLGFLTILGLYAFYLAWTGAPVLMKASEDLALRYAAIVIVCAFGLIVILTLIQGAVVTKPLIT
jgi:hypothetical protein